MSSLLGLVSCLLHLVILARCQDTSTLQPCVPQDDSGIIEISCKGYKKCDNNLVIEHLCDSSMVFDRDSFQCVDRISSVISCADRGQCNGKADGIYADEADKCETYVRCLGEAIIAHSYCPTKTVFSNAIQTCAFKDSVPPPCGTKTTNGTNTVVG
ncbi:uncharacterized protein LOC106062495 [Biomphalaria glabrata]|uniref:Uncharacterized protein LOC106062495 n=1 Tax=Biomphalaria glabrata TaxID=6526 RepID=A0A9W2YK14_BIOGL|nr:uncharacterized protein LOC106062495 [Biomphalaria glabrata]